jgi:hypothetical protein
MGSDRAFDSPNNCVPFQIWNEFLGRPMNEGAGRWKYGHLSLAVSAGGSPSPKPLWLQPQPFTDSRPGPFSLFTKCSANIFCPCSNSFHGLLQSFAGYAKLVRPIADFIILMNIDSVSLTIVGDFRIISHEIVSCLRTDTDSPEVRASPERANVSSFKWS